MKKILLFIIIALLVGCGQPEVHTQTNTALTEPLSGPFYLTTFGQSADVVIMKSILTKITDEVTYNSILTAEELSEESTLFIAVGASSKGMEAANITFDEELSRAQSIMTEIEEKNMKVVVFHFGGEERRGHDSDKLIEVVCNAADVILVMSAGNSDGFFTELAEMNSSVLIQLGSITEVSDQIEVLIK